MMGLLLDKRLKRVYTGAVNRENSGVVIDPVANVYSRPDPAADMTTQAPLGTPLFILSGGDGWYQARLPDTYEGWVEAGQVRAYRPGEAAYAVDGPLAEVCGLMGLIYREASVTRRPPMTRATIGVCLEMVGEGEEWVQVRLPDRSLGWIQSGDVAPAAAADSPRRSVHSVIATARRFLGLPYLWGGTTPLGIDCSGFVQLVYRLNGVRLLRDADLQYHQAGLAPVAGPEVQAGDLLFFGSQHISHVGLSIGGREFIHATTYRRPVVQISSLDEPHWVELFAGARRP